jgi:Phytanoyl-CoA dioxygenase (PhyH)
MFIFLSSAKSFAKNKWIGSPRLNRWGIYGLRKRTAQWCADLRRIWIGRRLTLSQKQTFQAQGYLTIENFLAPQEFEAVKAELCAASWDMLEMHQPPAMTHRSNFDSATLQARFPALNRLINNPALLRWIRYAAGCSGRPIAALQIIRSGGVAQGHDPQTDWHCDTFHAAAKAWLFLHDVAPQHGPLAYATGSQRPTAAHQLWDHANSINAAKDPNPMHSNGSLRTDAQTLAQLGYANLYAAAVPANTLVVADTGGFHRRTPSPEPTLRLEIYFSLRRNPFFAGLYPHVLSLPIVRSRWAGWAYRYYQHLLAKGTPDWIPRGARALLEDERHLLEGLAEKQTTPPDN